MVRCSFLQLVNNPDCMAIFFKALLGGGGGGTTYSMTFSAPSMDAFCRTNVTVFHLQYS